jgi:hypothetical protein
MTSALITHKYGLLLKFVCIYVYTHTHFRTKLQNYKFRSELDAGKSKNDGRVDRIQ